MGQLAPVMACCEHDIHDDYFLIDTEMKPSKIGVEWYFYDMIGEHERYPISVCKTLERRYQKFLNDNGQRYVSFGEAGNVFEGFVVDFKTMTYQWRPTTPGDKERW